MRSVAMAFRSARPFAVVLDLRKGESMAMAAAYGSGRERRGSRAGDEWCVGDEWFAGESGWVWVSERVDVGSIRRGRLRFHRAGRSA